MTHNSINHLSPILLICVVRHNLWWNSCSYFSQKIEFSISCKLSSKETICIKFEILFARKNKKDMSESSQSSAESFTHYAESVSPCPAEPRSTLPLQTV